MVQHSFGYVRWRNGAKEEDIDRLLKRGNIVDQLGYRFDIGIEPFFDDLDLVGEVDSCGAIARTV